MSRRNDFETFLIGFLVGSVTGAVTALLLAPQSGEETRAQIKDEAIKLSEKASETADTVIKQAETAYTGLKQQAETLASDVKTQIDNVAKTTKDKATELKHHGKVVLEEQEEPESLAAD
jgi:gas vesicle protein